MRVFFVVLFLTTAFLFTGCPKVEKEKVTVEMFVMSKCPYGAQVVNGITPVLEKMGDHIDFHLEYIGKETEPGKFTSMKGETEVQGNLIQLCAMKHYPKKYLDLFKCINKDFRKIPGNFEECAKETGLDAAKIKTCSEGDEGKSLISASYKRAEEKGAKGSPTIFIAGEPYKKGRKEADFMREICSHYKKSKPAACSDIPEPKKIKAIMISDKRCAACNPDRLSQNLKGVFPGLETEVLDYSDPKGKEMYDKLAANGHNLLPLVIFNKDVEGDEGYQRISRFVIPQDDYRILRVGAKFDPTKEICDNNIDDTGNELVDCADPDCKDELICRKEEKKRLDLFVMSMCPYGTKALDAMKEVLEAFKSDGLKFHINYIANEVEPGKFTALHKEPEVKENIRQLCAIKHYPKNFWDYIWCRNKNIRSSEWKTCATGPIKADKIEKCAEGDEGKKLLSENIKAANSLGIGASPTWIINNKHKASGISPEDIKNHVCRHNPELKGCKATLSKGTGPTKGGCGS